MRYKSGEEYEQTKISNNRCAVIAAVISVGAFASFGLPSGEYVYVQSDITKANPNINIAPATYSLATTEIEETRHSVVLTVSGQVVSIGDIIPWTDESGNELGFVPVTVEINQKVKDEITNSSLKRGSEFTVYLGGVYEGGAFFLHGFEPQFEIGENVILHIGHDQNGPEFVDDGIYFANLGKYGKYKVVDNIAYNEKFNEGIPVSEALNKSQ